jgi:glutathione S-transferase
VRDTHFPARLRQIEALLGSRAGLPCDFSENEKDESNASSSGPYVCGAAMTIADLSLYVLLDGLEADATHKYCAPLATGFVKAFVEKECPRLKRLYDAVRTDARVQRWNEERWGIRR